MLRAQKIFYEGTLFSHLTHFNTNNTKSGTAITLDDIRTHLGRLGPSHVIGTDELIAPLLPVTFHRENGT